MTATPLMHNRDVLDIDGPRGTAPPAAALPRSSPRSTSTSPARVLPPLALALAAVIWGVTFTVADDAVTLMPPADVVAWRFGLGAAVLTLVTRNGSPLPPRLWRRGVVLGGLLGSGFLLQTWGLTYTDALSSGFLTSLLVVVAPLAGWLMFGQRLSRSTWSGVALATCGVLALSLHEARLGPGEVITLVSAAVWGVHVVLLSRWSVPGHTARLARCQTSTVAVMALVAVLFGAAATSRPLVPELPPNGRAWLSLLFLAVLATAAAMALLSWSQSRVDATRAAVILTLEPAVAGLTAALTGSPLTGRVVLGAVLLIGAIYVVELGRLRRSAPVSRRY